MKNLIPFEDYDKKLFEADNADKETPEKDTPENHEMKKKLRSAMISSLLGGDVERILAGGDTSQIPDTKEIKNQLPYKGCGATSPYSINKTPLTKKTIKAALEVIRKIGTEDNRIDYKEVIDEIVASEKPVLIGIRAKLAEKKSAGDVFACKLYYLDPKSNDTDNINPYQITTLPGLSYYGKMTAEELTKAGFNNKGIAILMPGTYAYNVGQYTLHGKTRKALTEASKSKVERIPPGANDYGKDYRPGNPEIGSFGIHIHPSSKETGICVGPWSIGCQVFANGSDFEEVYRKLGSGKVLYALIEDDMWEKHKSEIENELSGPEIAKKSEEKPKEDEGDG